MFSPLSLFQYLLPPSLFSVPSFLLKIGSLQASPSENIFLNKGTSVHNYLPLQQEREFETLMEVCVRPLPILMTYKA